MKYFLFIVLLVIIVITAGCVGGNKNIVVAPAQTTTTPTIIITTTVSTTISTMIVSQTTVPTDPFVGTWIRSYFIGNTTSEAGKVSCSFDFVSSGNFTYTCASPSIRVIPSYGKWKNLGNNLYTAMYPNKDHPEQPNGFYSGSYCNFSYNPEFDTLTDITDLTNQQHQIVWVRMKKP